MEKLHKKKNERYLGTCILTGLIVSGLLVGNALEKFRSKNCSIRVKGIGERIVKADYGIWEIKFQGYGKTFPEARSLYQESLAKITHFLKNEGFKESEFYSSVPQVSIREAGIGQEKSTVVSGTVFVESKAVEKLKASSLKTSSLLDQNVFLDWVYGPSVKYYLDDFDAMRPDLLEISMESAHKMAEKFAEHSKVKVGRIKDADQGNFSILPAKPNEMEESSLMKKVRVISHITYALE